LQVDRVDETALRIKEAAIYKLARLLTQGKRFSDVMNLLKENNAFFGSIPKARTAKIVRSIIDIVANVPDSLNVQVTLCQDVIAWCKAEKRTFLRQRIEAKLAALLLQKKEVTPALTLLDGLLYELKKLDDKQMLTEVHLTESRVYLALENLPKAKAAMTSSRSAATAIYVTPLLQAELDEMAGLLQCEDDDYTTAYSYFQEAFEAYDSANDARALRILSYMVLAKILGGSPDDVSGLLNGKQGLKYSSGPELQALSHVAKAAKARSLEQFQQVVTANSAYLRSDDLISRRLDVLYNTMLESNLIKIISPFSCVELSHVARLIKLSESEVERKLAHMILDRKFSGILDQGKGHLIVYETSAEDVSFKKGLEIIENMGHVVSALAERGKRLNTKTVPSSAVASAEKAADPIGSPRSPKSSSKSKGGGAAGPPSPSN